MIRIVCGDEPEELVLSRDEHLARARLRGAPPSDKEIVGYDVAREQLAARHLYHCAYCELSLRNEAAPIEHYRPKGTADDVDWSGLRPLPARCSGGAVDTDAERLQRGLPPATEGGMTRIKWRDGRAYWWLAWTWENHLYGCTGCNSGLKLTRFPQRKGAVALAAHGVPPGAEQPLLLDPTDPKVDPLDHIQFREVNGRWIPTPRDGSDRGAWTIAILRLATSPALLTAYTNRLKRLGDSQLVAAVEGMRGAAASPQLTQAWATLCDDLLAPTEDQLGLTWDWLDAKFPEPWRSARNLVLPRPVRHVAGLAVGVPRPAIAQILALAGLPQALADQVRVARNFAGRSDNVTDAQRPLSELVPELLQHRHTATNDELATLLRCAPETVRRHRP